MKLTLSLQAVVVSQHCLDQSLKQFSYLVSDPFKQIVMISTRGILVKNEVMSRPVINESEFC